MTTKVVVTGAYSTGKTILVGTLAAALADYGISCTVLSDVSRQCPMPLNTAQTGDGTLWLVGNQVSAEIEACAAGSDVVLCDRGVPDILAHHLEVLSRRPESRVELLRPFLEDWLSTYDLLLLSRVDEAIPILADGLRNPDAAYRTLLDGYAVDVVSGLARTVTLPFGDGVRLETSLQAVKRRLAV